MPMEYIRLGIYYGLRHLFLNISEPYIVKNFIIIGSLLPTATNTYVDSEGTTFNSSYAKLVINFTREK